MKEQIKNKAELCNSSNVAFYDKAFHLDNEIVQNYISFNYSSAEELINAFISILKSATANNPNSSLRCVSEAEETKIALDFTLGQSQGDRIASTYLSQLKDRAEDMEQIEAGNANGTDE